MHTMLSASVCHQGLGVRFRVEGSRFRVEGLGLRVQGLGF
jgi:hypothetical protein